MPAKSRDFRDEFDQSLRDVANLSDRELERLLEGHSPGEAPSGSRSVETLEPGSRVRGTVIDTRGGEVLVELDTKSHGMVDATDFDPDGLPEIGSVLEASFLRYDETRGLAILSVREAQREVLWEEIRPGRVVEGVVSECNRGGLILDIKGVRAFLPVSQIERERVEELSVYVGRRLRCEVTSVDRSREDLVVSRRTILEKEAEELRGQALARLGEGEVLKGTITRLTEHGAFVDIGGVEGLVHASRIERYIREAGKAAPLYPGQQLEVEVLRVDPLRQRVSLDFRRVAGETWNRTIEGYSTGEEVTGWVTRVTSDGAFVAIDEGVEGLIPRRVLLGRRESLHRGAIIRTAITAIDRDRRLIELRIVEERRGR